MGGHDVPEAVVQRRFTSGLRNFFTLYQGVAGSWQMLDNSVSGGPRVIARRTEGSRPEILDAAAWQHLLEIL